MQLKAADTTLEDLWNRADSVDSAGEDLPPATRRYLDHAIAPKGVPASRVRLRMHGEIKLKGWLPFTADQVIRSDGDMLWRATVKQSGVPIRGFDRLVTGQGAMQWKLFGLVPVMTAAGSDITRSTIARVVAESVWLPTVFLRRDITWTMSAAMHPVAHRMLHGEATSLELALDSSGRVDNLKIARWADPDGAGFRYVDFGALAIAEETFGGYTIPTRLRVGYYIDTPRFESEGEFFRVTIDDAAYR